MNQTMVVVLMWPRDQVREALCARTCELAPYLPEVEQAVLHERRLESDGLERCTHSWQLRTDLPAVLAHHIDRNLLLWVCRVEWRLSDYTSRWSLAPQAASSALSCAATVQLAPAVRDTATRVNLDLTLDGVRLAPGLQTIASAILTKHFRQLVDATGQFLARARGAMAGQPGHTVRP